MDHVVFREGFCSLYLVDKQIPKKSLKGRRYAAFGGGYGRGGNYADAEVSIARIES
jgi:hypothetical protein